MTMSTVVLNSKNFNSADPSDKSVFSKKNKNNNYKLRDASIKKREEMEHRKNQPRKRGPKPRPKSAPMSKYRRKTANLRERLRMGEINVAFEKLRDKLPNPMAQAGKAKCEKLTKINILHVAINYIRAMENLLETGDSGIASFSEMTKNPLRDESEKKVEMQRVLATLMQRADKVHHQARSKKRSKGKTKRSFENEEEISSSSSEDSEEEELEEEMEDPEDLADPCPEPIYEAPITDTSWNTSSDSGISEPNSVPMCTISSQNNNSSDPMLCTSTTLVSHSKSQFATPATHANHPEDFMDFTDLEDLMDSLHGMPKIDFEDNFEMFPWKKLYFLELFVHNLS